jgi:hypothetical protein
MTDYQPNNWVVIKFKGDHPHYKVLVGWSGGYMDGSSWRINSGITRVGATEDSFLFYGTSGSCYECDKQSYCLRMNNVHIWTKLQEMYGDKVELMPEDTDWFNVDWIIK